MVLPQKTVGEKGRVNRPLKRRKNEEDDKAITRLQGEKDAQRSIHYAIEAEKIHAELYKSTKEEVGNGKGMDISDICICPVCGYTYVGENPPAKCPVCGFPGEKFVEF